MKTEKLKLAVIAIARSTFDLDYAREKVETFSHGLNTAGLEIIGNPKQLFLEAEDAKNALENIQKKESPDALLIVQASFTDAKATVQMAEAMGNTPVALWSFSEPRTGGRLRLNSFCGANLAAHGLSRKHIPLFHIQGNGSEPEAFESLCNFVCASSAVRKLRQSKLLVIGEHPQGFDPCDYDKKDVKRQFGITIDTMTTQAFFALAKTYQDEEVADLYAIKQQQLPNLKTLERSAVYKTLKAAKAMQKLAQKEKYAGIAVRCWPEFFVEYGAAACGALGIMNEAGIPAGCEADVYGVITSILMQNIGQSPVFNTDLVDISAKDNTVVFWHCGQAPYSMKSENAVAKGTLHSNRKLPLLSEFPLKAGRATFARFSRGFNTLKLLHGTVDMIDEPLAFSGTAGVARLQTSGKQFMDEIIIQGLEHHVTLAYGDYSPILSHVGQILNIPNKKIGEQ